MKIGKVRLKNNLILAPMAGVNDLAYRLLCRDHHVGLTSSEMVSAEALVRSKSFVFPVDKKDSPLSVQLFGSNPEVFVKALPLLEKKADIIDLNLGCPAAKILRSSSGSDLLKKPETIHSIILALKKVTKKPVTAKIRIYKDSKSTVYLAKIIEEAGADALTLHARTPSQGYSGIANWSVIRDVKSALNIPVIGNGDVKDFNDYENIIRETGCDCVMIGRGCVGYPQVFDNILKKKENTRSKETQLAEFRKYYSYYRKYNLNDFPKLKNHFMWFMSGFPGSVVIRRNHPTLKTEDQLVSYLDTL